MAGARGCTACELHAGATQTVFGVGPHGAALMLVGEQPGDLEDRMGRPFAGASERLVEEALAEARIDRADVYVTLAVKHIRRTAQGRRPPGPSHIRACWPWLRAEIDLVRPRALVCLGERVAEAIIGPGFRLSRHRGELVDTPLRPHVAATTDPREIAELADPARRAEMGAFVRDLRAIGRTLRSTG